MDLCEIVAARAMLEEINKSRSPKNVMISPMSMSGLLSVLALGSNGGTLKNFLRFLGSRDTEELLSRSRSIFSLVSSSSDDDSADAKAPRSRNEGGEAETSRNPKRPRRSQSNSVDQPESPAMEAWSRRHIGQEPEFSRANANWVDHRSLERPWRSGNGAFLHHEAPRIERAPEIFMDHRSLDRPWSFPNNSADHDFSMSRNCGREPDFSMANAIWVDNHCHLNPSFVELAQSEFRASVKNVDLFNQGEQVWKDVNAWAEKETKGLIKDLLTTIPSPPLCLANALYIKGNWSSPFKASNTRHEDFHLLNAGTTKVPFMIKQNKHHSFGLFPDFKLLKLEYERGKSTNKQFSMYIFLPHKRNGLRSLLKKFSSDCRSLRPENLQLQYEKLERVWIPKMKFSYDFAEAHKHIEAEGLTLPFRFGADFSKMASQNEIIIGEIIQKTFIEVNEEGTEAAAVTFGRAFGCAMKMVVPPKPSFVADHPFMFMIVEEFTKLVVFTGAVLNPLLNE